MPHDRRFRFGVQLRGAATAEGWLEKVRKVEALGYASLTVPDHFGDQLGPIVALAAAASVTQRLQLGALVFGNDYRHPVVLAKEMATLDVLSEGRIFFGLGAGWMKTDYDAAGMPYDAPAERVGRMTEALAVFKGLFSDGPFSFQGTHYRISALDGLPKPVQRPHPPILIGGGGKRVLSFAGREADIVGINANLKAGVFDARARLVDAAAATRRKIAWVRDAAGGRFDDLELSMQCFVVAITDDRERLAAAVATRFEVDTDTVLASPHVLIGTVDQMVDALQRVRDRYGISYIFHAGESTVTPGVSAEAFAPVVESMTGR